MKLYLLRIIYSGLVSPEEKYIMANDYNDVIKLINDDKTRVKAIEIALVSEDVIRVN